VSRDLDWALHKARNALNGARFSKRGRAEDPQRWEGVEGDLYRALKELIEAAEQASQASR